MTAQPRFLQIHSLSAYAAALLNRDDSGQAKRLLYGGVLRTRVSSQCLKRHWRHADDMHSLYSIAGATEDFRSRELVTLKVLGPLRQQFPEEIVDALEPDVQAAVYGPRGIDRKSRQTLLLGAPEIDWLRSETEYLAARALQAGDGDPGRAARLAAEAAKTWREDCRTNFQAMREATALPGGLAAALFGRMVTSDPSANIVAPLHVAHAFTVHAEETESDFLTAVDDLSNDSATADLIQETELTSGLFYGYVVVDLNGLLANLADSAEMAGQVLHSLVHLIAEISPGAKRGSTAPYGRAGFMLLEAGNRQPRSLAEAWRIPCPATLDIAIAALVSHLHALDDVYATGEERRFMSLADAEVPGAQRGSLASLAAWAEGVVGRETS